MTAVSTTVALLGLCAGIAAAPINVPTWIDALDDTPATISRDLDFPSALIAQPVVFDPYSDTPDESDAITIPLNTTLAAPEPSTLLFVPLGFACLALFATGRRLSRLLRDLKKPGRSGRRKVRREFRMMA